MFNFFKKDKGTNTNVNTSANATFTAVSMPSNVPEEHAQVLQKINLKKEEVHKICLEKKSLTNLKAKVKLVLDYSGSMSNLYSDGTVQKVVEEIVPLALQFDDDGELEVYLFSKGVKQIANCTLKNVVNYIQREVHWSYGSTYYAPVIQQIADNCTGDLPEYVIFITDGDNSDKDKTTSVMKAVSNKPIFWQFVGVGNSSFSYLEKLDDMEGRYVDNADFFKVAKMSDITYPKLLTEFPTWLENDKVKSMLK